MVLRRPRLQFLPEVTLMPGRRPSALPAVLTGLLAGLVAGCVSSPVTPSFEADRYADHVRVLASDDFEGRRPATAGEDKTIAYLEQEFRRAGLQPGASGSFRQPVPLVELMTRPDAALRISGAGGDTLLKYADDAVYWTKRVVPEFALTDSELVFVGYGIVEPAMRWNDYAGLDMRGKTAVILVNDPGFATGDPELFNGRAMTYHGRWTYKYEEAARQGAAGAIIVHEEAPAAYPWEVLRNGAARPQLAIDTPGEASSLVGVEGWMTRDAAVKVFLAAGLDYDTVKAAAARRGFRPMPLPLRATTRVANDIHRITSNNVVGILPGTKRPDEYVIYTAHWDHLGRTAEGSGDTIFNGAVDNATGTAALIELARAFGEVRPRPERSVVFVGFTGEEYGLLGSEYFADHPGRATGADRRRLQHGRHGGQRSDPRRDRGRVRRLRARGLSRRGGRGAGPRPGAGAYPGERLVLPLRPLHAGPQRRADALCAGGDRFRGPRTGVGPAEEHRLHFAPVSQALR